MDVQLFSVNEFVYRRWRTERTYYIGDHEKDEVPVSDYGRQVVLKTPGLPPGEYNGVRVRFRFRKPRSNKIHGIFYDLMWRDKSE